MADNEQAKKILGEENDTQASGTDDGSLEVTLLLMNKDVGQVIGKGGEKITHIRESSGAVVKIPKLIESSHERTATVSGSIEEVSTAILMIANIISEENPMISLLAEHRNLGPVIGKQGVNINRIREETQANVHIESAFLPNSTQKEIRISGDSNAFSEAVKAVVGNLAEGKSRVRLPYVPCGAMNYMNSPSGRGHQMPVIYGAGAMPRSMEWQGHHEGGSRKSVLRFETTITIPKGVVGKIIGRGGSNINAIRQQSGAKIIVASDEEHNSSERDIKITGSRSSIARACSMIETLATP